MAIIDEEKLEKERQEREALAMEGINAAIRKSNKEREAGAALLAEVGRKMYEDNEARKNTQAEDDIKRAKAEEQRTSDLEKAFREMAAKYSK